MKIRTSLNKITSLAEGEIFVFGSNAEGNHDGGAAKLAAEKFGAINGQGFGLQGRSFAIDTMSGIAYVQLGIVDFIDFAKHNSDKTFLVTEIGCGIAGHKPEQIAPLFAEAVSIQNIYLPESFWKVLGITPSIRGYKVFNPDFKCRDFQFKEGETYKYDGPIEICARGFHFCTKASDCFEYYSFDPNNIVCEVEAIGDYQSHEEDSKICTNAIRIIRRLTWHEVLDIVNVGANNTGNNNSGNSNSGDRNSGDSNSGDRNSGIWNSGDRNSGDSNSGNWNSGIWNSGDRNSGDRNSGNWNSGNRNSGDSNSGYRNSGAFCTDDNPTIRLFNKETNIKVRDWENYKPVQLMYNLLNTNIWIPLSMMSDEEKKQNPKHETTEGFLKKISYKDAWANMWGNLDDESKNEFTSLPNFDASLFFEITGVKI